MALLVETSNAFSRELLHGVRDWMCTHGAWSIHLSEHGRGDQPPPWLGRWHGHGIIARIETQAIARAVSRAGVPVVNVSASGLAPRIPAVISDSAGIGRLAAEHLLERGLRHFGYCGDARFFWSHRHGEFFSATLRAASRSCDVFPAAAADFDDWEREQAKLAKWLRGLPKPVGIMTCYDIRGQQLLDVCRRAGLQVPHEVAVIGQHNDELLCELCEPPLTSVIPNARRAGWEAAALLHTMMNGRRAPVDLETIEPIGVAVRQSTDIVAVDDPKIAAAVRFIRSNACSGIGVSDVLKAVPMSRTLMERHFQRLFGRAPYQEIVRVRIEAAKQTIAATDLSIAEVAERAGFSSPEHFSTAFSQHVQCSPRDFRRRVRARRGKL